MYWNYDDMFKNLKYKDAVKITRDFQRGGETYSPFLASDWTFEIEDGKIYLSSENAEYRMYFSSIEHYTTFYIFGDDYEIVKNKLKGAYYYTSFGFITEEMYHRALDVLELGNTIKENDMIKGNIYTTDKGKQVIYLGKLDITYISIKDDILIKDKKTTKSLVLELLTTNIYNLSSLKIVEDQNRTFTGRETLRIENLLKRETFEDYIFVGTPTKNINRIFILNNDYVSLSFFKGYELDTYFKYKDFIEDNKNEFQLKKIKDELINKMSENI